MFLNEQRCQFYELQPAVRNEDEFVDAHVWSPVANRHTFWTRRPLVRCDERGNMIRGSRQRNPFIAKVHS